MSNMPENIRRMWEEAANIKSTRPEPRLPDDLVKRGPKQPQPNPQYPDLDDLIKREPKRPTLPSLEHPMRRKTDTASKGKPMVPVSPLHSKKDMKGLPSHSAPVAPVAPSLSHPKSKSKPMPMVPPPHSPLN